MKSTEALAGVRVVVTRASQQAEQLIALLESDGAQVEKLPLLEIVPPRDPRPLERAATELALFQWLVLTSSNSVAALLPLAGGSLPRSLRVAVVGEKSADALRQWDVEPDLVANVSRAEGLAAALAPYLGRRQRVLLPQASDARPLLSERLAEAGAEVVRVCAYEKRIPREAVSEAARIFAHGPLGWVTFTSPSTVKALVQILGTRWESERASLFAVSIGKVTSGELRE